MSLKLISHVIVALGRFHAPDRGRTGQSLHARTSCLRTKYNSMPFNTKSIMQVLTESSRTIV